MNILCSASATSQSGSFHQKLHVSDTCFLHELYNIERYVITTYRLHELHVCIQDGYVTTTYPNYKIDALNV